MKKKVILIGAGGRGYTYTNIMKDSFSDYYEVVAVAEPINERRNYIKEKHSLPDEMCFTTWEPLLAMPKLADIALICTMDRDHVAPALAAIEVGYDLMLEKPAGATPEECRAIQRAAEKKGVFVLICHVLRFTKFFMALKNIVDSGKIGRVMSIQAIEAVNNIHQSHSFVRGNWRNSDESSPMILQKTCHDFDIISWILGKKCKRVQSFGSLSHFTRENAPADAPEYCIEGCPHADTCYYNAVKLYMGTHNRSGWFQNAATKKFNPTPEDCEKAARETDYGKCVYKCPNNVVDRQVVNLEYEDGTVVSFTMSAFNKGGRNIRIMGTDGELSGNAGDNFVSLYSFATEQTEKIDLDSGFLDDSILSGHGGGDAGIIKALKDLIEGIPNKSICDIAESCDNHMISFAAEESRLTGKVVDLDEFSARF
jgi:predicted dehydrogenase